MSLGESLSVSIAVPTAPGGVTVPSVPGGVVVPTAVVPAAMIPPPFALAEGSGSGMGSVVVVAVITKAQAMGSGTGVVAARPLVSSQGSGSGAGSVIAYDPSTAASAAGSGSGSGVVTASPAVVASATGAGTGTSTARPAVTAVGSGSGTGAVTARAAVKSAASGSGAGTVTSTGYPGTVQYADNFDRADTADIATGTNWVDRAYAGGVFRIESSVATNNVVSSERVMNAYYLAQALSSANQWATVEVVGIPTASDSALGVTLRHDTNRGVVVQFYSNTVTVRDGATNGTTTGTVLGTASLPASIKSGDKVGAVIVGSGSATTIRCVVNNLTVATFSNVNVGSTGSFAGIAMSRQPSSLRNWTAGVV